MGRKESNQTNKSFKLDIFQGFKSCEYYLVRKVRTEEGKYQESIQSSTTHDPRHRMGK